MCSSDLGTHWYGSNWFGIAGKVRSGPFGLAQARYGNAGIGQEAQGCANTRMFFITGAKGPLHIGDYHGY